MDYDKLNAVLRFAADPDPHSHVNLLLKVLEEHGDLEGSRGPYTEYTNRLIAADAFEEAGRSVEGHLLRTKTPLRIEGGEVKPDFLPHCEGYPVMYCTEGGSLFCAGCVNHHARSWAEGRVAGETGDNDGDHYHPDGLTQYPLWEGPPIQCDSCGTEIESAYGDPEAEGHE